MIPIIYPYSMVSKSAKILARALGTRRVFPDGDYRYKRNHKIINWGSSTVPDWDNWRVSWSNSPKFAANAVNKIKALSCLPEDICPVWTVNKEEAAQWNSRVFCRTLLTGHGGSGIVVANAPEELVDAPLYTKGVRKDREFRVHVWENGSILDFSQKKRRAGGTTIIPGVRSHINGWVFCREGVVLPESVADAAIRAVRSLRLHFGAVDVCTTLDGDVKVFEVNTAPGISGTTVEKYVKAIRNSLILEE